MAYFQSIMAVDFPADLSVDDSLRAEWSVTFDIQGANPLDDLEDIIAARLITAGIATAVYNGVTGDMLLGGRAVIPPANDNTAYIHISTVSGAHPLQTRDDYFTDRPTVRVSVHCKKWSTCRTKVFAIYNNMKTIHNTVLVA